MYPPKNRFWPHWQIKIPANFEGGSISSDGGVSPLRQVDERIGLSKAIGRALNDPRNPHLIKHTMTDLVVQRLYAMCCGYEDLNNHAALRFDPLMQTAVGSIDALGSSPTLSCSETRVDRNDIVALSCILIEQLIAQHEVAPEELILDIDASDIPLHGDQEDKEFHGYHNHYCCLPLYVFCGKSILAWVLRQTS